MAAFLPPTVDSMEHSLPYLIGIARLYAAFVPLTALHLDLIQQLQGLRIVPGFKEFADLIEMAMDQKQIIRGWPAAAAGLLPEIIPERIVALRLIDVSVDHGHQTMGIARTIDVVKADVAIGWVG